MKFSVSLKDILKNCLSYYDKNYPEVMVEMHLSTRLFYMDQGRDTLTS